MHFDRELKTYAEPISADELKEGSAYFFVSFVDDELLIPTMRTVVFVGRNFEPDEQRRVYFPRHRLVPGRHPVGDDRR